MSYPLGASLIPRIGVRRERWPGGYDLRCVPLVQVGALVEPDELVMRVARSEVRPALPHVPRLFLPTASTGPRLPGASSSRALPLNELLAAGLRGVVVGVTGRGGVVIEGQVALLSGALGAGRQITGPLVIWQGRGAREPAPSIPSSAILVVPGPLNLAMLEQAVNSGIAGVIASSISSRDFENFVHSNLIDLLQCTNAELLLAHPPPLTLLLTEGLGTLAMPARTLNLLNKHQGKIVLLSGATSLSSGVYPELLLPLTSAEEREYPLALKPEAELIIGTLVRVCSGSYEGAIGQIDYLFSHSQRFPSGIRERAARVRLEDGSQLVVPLPVLERIG